MGITLFNLLTKDHPFKGNGIHDLAQNIKTKEPNLKLLGEESPQLKNLLARIFEKDPEKRISIQEMLEDPWVTENGANSVNLDMIQSESDK